MRPIWQVLADGADITARLAGTGARHGLLGITITDRAGLESDTVQIEIADPAGDIPWPRHGARLSVSIGYASEGLTRMGEYIVDSIELASPPRRWTISASAVELRETGAPLKVRRTRSWEGWPLGTVVSEVAASNGLQAKITPELAIIHFDRVDQTNESDLALLTRLAKQVDAIATVKGGYLLFTRRGSGETVSGQPMPAIRLRPEDCSEWRVSLSDQGRYTAVEARFYDRDQAEEVWTRAGQGDGESVYRLRRTYPDRAQAQAAAEAKLGALARGASLLSVTMPGRTEMAAESPLILEIFGDNIDGAWITTTTTHRLSDAGYTTQAEAERQP